MQYIAILDHHHLDHSFFMKAFAESMALQRDCKSIILHGDSPYTDRLMQTGMMRDDAILRSTRDLNHRIIALLADNGISAIGINGYQKGIIERDDQQLAIETGWIDNRPAATHLVISNLVRDKETHRVVPVPLSHLADELRTQLHWETLIVFPNDDAELVPDQNRGQGSHGDSRIADKIPADLKPLPDNCFLCATSDFGTLPDTSRLLRVSE